MGGPTGCMLVGPVGAPYCNTSWGLVNKMEQRNNRQLESTQFSKLLLNMDWAYAMWVQLTELRPPQIDMLKLLPPS